MEAPQKYYLVDQSFRLAKLGIKNLDYGRVLENIVAIELLRRGYEIYVGIIGKVEVDFIAIKRNEKLYIQVCDNLSNGESFDRECKSLLKIRDCYPKIILTRTMNPSSLYEGIKIEDIGEWLLE